MKRKNPDGPPKTPGEADEDYDVGYRKPPAEHRFRTGQSGNPKGRPRGSKSMATLFKGYLLGKVPVREAGGRTRSISRAELIVRNTINRATAGDQKQAKFVFDMADRLNVQIEQPPVHVVVSYVKPVIPRKYQRLVKEAKEGLALREARETRLRETEASGISGIEPPMLPLPPQPPRPPRPTRRFHPLIGRQRRR